MKVRAKIQKWGNGLALRVAGVMRELPGFQAGTQVEVEVDEQGFTVRRSDRGEAALPFSEQDLLEGLSERRAHADAIAEPRANETGDGW